MCGCHQPTQPLKFSSNIELKLKLENDISTGLTELATIVENLRVLSLHPFHFPSLTCFGYFCKHFFNIVNKLTNRL
jgi:hypothetical protein